MKIVLDIEHQKAAVEALRQAFEGEELEIAIESETDLLEALGKAVDELDETEAMVNGNNYRIEQIELRNGRLKESARSIRNAIQAALEASGLKSIRLPHVTIGLKAVPRGLQVTDEASIPADFWKARDPQLDRRALIEALKEGASIPGATLDNGLQTIQFKRG